MAQKREKEQPELATKVIQQSPAQPGSASIGVVPVAALVYIFCLLISITPLQRLHSTLHFSQVKTNPLLTIWGSWLPANLHLAKNAATSQHSTSILELILLMALIFVIYGLSALLLQRQPARSKSTLTFWLIALAVIPLGLILILAPVLVSPAIFTYADYGLSIAAFHANPYFVPPTAHPENPLIAFDIWRSSTAADGPVWLVFCAFVAKVATVHPLRYLLAFRLFGLAIHLINIVLVAAILRKLGRSPRMVATGMLLYAWNPLILLETSLNGYNDSLVLTFLLLGMLLGIQTEQAQPSSFLRPTSYLPPLISFTLAALIQPLVAPVAVLFLLLLACKAYTITSDFSATPERRQRPLAITISGILVSSLVVLALYGPFWIGHSVPAILASLRSAPPTQFAQGSILAALQQWNTAHGRPIGFAALLSQHNTWDALSGVIIIVGLLIGALSLWRVPTMRNLVLIALAILTTLLLITPWFQPSYLIWTLGMAVVLLPANWERLKSGLVAFSLAASISALLVYLFNGYQPSSNGILLTPLLIFGLPALAFLIAFFLKDTFFLAELWNGKVHEAASLSVEEIDIEESRKGS
jgi:hypothetical protein